MKRLLLLILLGWNGAVLWAEPPVPAAQTLRGKVLCGYQGWFRTPGDGAGHGWAHWSRDAQRVTPETLTFEMWPDLGEFPPEERFTVPGWPEGTALFSSDRAATVRRHFRWMEQYGIDGVWLQHFVVELPGAPAEKRNASRRRVLEHVRAAARETGRVWALTFDLTGVKPELAYTVVTREWLALAAAGVPEEGHYLREGGRPVVQLFGFYPADGHNEMTPEVGGRLITFFKEAGCFVIGGGEWAWRRNADPAWQAMYRKLDGLSPWNVANVSLDGQGVRHATTNYWAEDQTALKERRQLWLPVVWPGFGWSNLQRLPPGSGAVPRRGGAFLWEQFVTASKLGADSINVAMFDEVDEGTAIFKVSNTPPAGANFATYEGLPSDWYLRLVGEATRRWRAGEVLPKELPLATPPVK